MACTSLDLNASVYKFLSNLFSALGDLFTHFSITKTMGSIFYSLSYYITGCIPEAITAPRLIPNVITPKYTLSDFYSDKLLAIKKESYINTIRHKEFWEYMPKMSEFNIKPTPISNGGSNHLISIQGSLMSFFNKIYTYIKNPINYGRLNHFMASSLGVALNIKFTDCNSIFNLNLSDICKLTVKYTDCNGKGKIFCFNLEDLRHYSSFNSSGKDNGWPFDINYYKNKIWDLTKPDPANKKLIVNMNHNNNQPYYPEGDDYRRIPTYMPNYPNNSNQSYIQGSGYDRGITTYMPNYLGNSNPSYIQGSGYDRGITTYMPNYQNNFNQSYIHGSRNYRGIPTYMPNYQSSFNQPYIQGGGNGQYIPTGLVNTFRPAGGTVGSTITSVPSSVSVQVSTTKPSHKNLMGFSSERLILRPLLASDFTAYLAIYKPETALYNSVTSPTPSQNQLETFVQNTREYFIERKLIHYAMVGIFLKNLDGTEGELIGDGGVFSLDNKDDKWPEIYYVLKKEFWNKGYATEFLKKFLDVWWCLPREKTSMRVQPISLGNLFYHQEVKERLVAEIHMSNKGSIRVIEKAGFEFCGFLGSEQKYGY
ncbi:GNAT family N-acetyltransferase [Streptomyces fungicidicus]|uniref:GNAT family N-acetyltransferase n=1 Tax=Streptomyces fungicidicus TaxID=68203 RepID=UPI003D7619AA